MNHDHTTEEIICTTSLALNELYELTRSHEEITGGTAAGGNGLPVSNLIHCIQRVLNDAFQTIEEEQTQGKKSAKVKIRAVAA
jgi:hypothetical protein